MVLISTSQLHLVETRLGVEFAEGGDNQRLWRSLGFQVWSVGRHRFWIWQRANLGLRMRLRLLLGSTGFASRSGKWEEGIAAALNITVLADWDSTSPSSAVGTIDRLRL